MEAGVRCRDGGSQSAGVTGAALSTLFLWGQVLSGEDDGKGGVVALGSRVLAGHSVSVLGTCP